MRVSAGERRVGALDTQVLHPADEAQRRVAHQDSGQHAALDQDLEAVADAENQPAAVGMGANGLYHRRAAGDGAAAEIVAEGEAAGQHGEIGAGGKLVLGMPHRARGDARAAEGTQGIPLAV